jgi:hypothetical protein
MLLTRLAVIKITIVVIGGPSKFSGAVFWEP